jgi:regulator of RNase E activity RraB
MADIVRGIDLDLAAGPGYTFETTEVLLREFDANVKHFQVRLTLMTSFPDDTNGEVLRQMSEHGVDFDVAHPVEFALLFDDAEAAKRCARAIDALGAYECSVHENDQVEGFDVIATRRLMLDHAAISRIEAELDDLAAQYGGRGDGWGVLTD